MNEDLATHGLLDIPMSDRSAIDFLDGIVQARDARIVVLEAAIRKADDYLNKKGDPIACHITLVDALGSVKTAAHETAIEIMRRDGSHD